VFYEDTFHSSLGVGLVLAIGAMMKLREFMTERRVAV
jgi:hypothetical protein